MTNNTIEKLLEDIDDTRRRAGLHPLDEVTRRDFMKKAGVAAVAGAAGLGSRSLNSEVWDVIKDLRRLSKVVPDSHKKLLADVEQRIIKW